MHTHHRHRVDLNGAGRTGHEISDEARPPVLTVPLPRSDVNAPWLKFAVNGGSSVTAGVDVVQRQVTVTAGRSMLARSDTADASATFLKYLLTVGNSRFKELSRWCTPPVSERSIPLRSDTYGIAGTFLSKSVLFRPPRAHPVNAGRAEVSVSDDLRRRKVLYTKGRVTLARSDTATGAIANAPPMRSIPLRTPREDLGASRFEWSGRRTILRRWSTPPIPSAWQMIRVLESTDICRGSSPPIRDDDSVRLVVREQRWRSVPL
jgi:hypothetical protein